MSQVTAFPVLNLGVKYDSCAFYEFGFGLEEKNSFDVRFFVLCSFFFCVVLQHLHQLAQVCRVQLLS